MAPWQSSTYFTNLLVDYFNIAMKNTGGDASCLNGNNEIHNRSIHNMFGSGLIYNTQHEKNWCRAAETSAEVYRYILNSALYNTSPHFSWYGESPRIIELRTIRCDIYPITSYPKTLYDRTQEGLFVGYSNIRATIKWWDLHTKIIKYCLSVKSDEHNNKFGKLWLTRSQLMTGTNFYILPKFKSDLSYHPFIKYDIFEFNVTFLPRGSHIDIDVQYCEHHNMYYISCSTNTSPWKGGFSVRNRTNVWIIIILIKETTTVPQFI